MIDLVVRKAAARLLFRGTCDRLLRRWGAFGKKLIWLFEVESLCGGIFDADKVVTFVGEGVDLRN